MKAVVASGPGGAEVLRVIDSPRPTPGLTEVVIAVAAAGVNRADVFQRMGFYEPPPGSSDILGIECSGVVVEVGSSVVGLSVGDRVCALLDGGGYAQFVAVAAGNVARVPDGMSSVEAAGLMEAAATVWSNVFSRAGLQPGETVLIHGGSSGIGTMAIQLARAAGARVVVTAGSAKKLEVCRQLGADVAIDYRTSDFADHLADARIAPDVILDIMGGAYLASNVQCLGVGGRLVVIGLQGGLTATLDLALLMAKRGTVTATSLRARPLTEKAAIVDGTVSHVWPLVGEGAVRPVIDSVFTLEDAADAHRHMESSAHIGKIVVTLPRSAVDDW